MEQQTEAQAQAETKTQTQTQCVINMAEETKGWNSFADEMHQRVVGIKQYLFPIIQKTLNSQSQVSNGVIQENPIMPNCLVVFFDASTGCNVELLEEHFKRLPKVTEVVCVRRQENRLENVKYVKSVHYCFHVVFVV